VSKRGERAVFLDRDGTIAKDVPYCSRVEDFDILDSVAQAIRLLNEQSFKVIVITNQSGIARGRFTQQTLALIHQRMQEELAEHGARVNGIFVCPHHPDEECECRKPKPALILQAAEEMGIELRLSYMVGDAPKDIEAGSSAGCKTVLVTTGPGQGKMNGQTPPPDHVANSLYEAAAWIVKDANSAASQAGRKVRP